MNIFNGNNFILIIIKARKKRRSKHSNNLKGPKRWEEWGWVVWGDKNSWSTWKDPPWQWGMQQQSHIVNFLDTLSISNKVTVMHVTYRMCLVSSPTCIYYISSLQFPFMCRLASSFVSYIIITSTSPPSYPIEPKKCFRYNIYTDIGYTPMCTYTVLSVYSFFKINRLFLKS